MNNKITNIVLGPKYSDKLQMLLALASEYKRSEILAQIPEQSLAEQSQFALSGIDVKVKNGKALTFSEAFWGMMHVVTATNNIIRKVVYPKMPFAEALSKGTYFLTIMALKETTVGLTPEEVAGMVAAGMIDVAYKPNVPDLMETAGTGADRGWKTGGQRVKTINASTLSAITLASMGHMTVKHGSYGNTAKVGSTDVPEQFGANLVNSTGDEIFQLLQKTGFWFSDAHAVKTLHYLSHLLMVETVNHVVGPMTPPIGRKTRLYKVMGVNHYIHPETIARAYTILHKMGVVNLGGVVALCGIRKADVSAIKNHSELAFLDEVGPKATLISLASEENFLGTHIVETHYDMGLILNEREIQVPNETQALMHANEIALSGIVDSPHCRYLSLNVAMALLSRDLEVGNGPECLDAYTNEALNHLETGAALNTLDEYVKATGGLRINW